MQTAIFKFKIIDAFKVCGYTCKREKFTKMHSIAPLQNERQLSNSANF